MKKTLIALIGVLALVLASCGGSNAVSVDVNSAADALASSLTFSEQLTKVSAKTEIKQYGLDEGVIEDAAGYRGTAAVVDEIAVFKTTDTAAVEDAAKAHIEAQTASYTSYAPNEVPKLDNAVIKTVGDCVIVCVATDGTDKVDEILAGISE